MLLRSNYRYSFFYIFVYNMTFLHILPNFNPLRTLEVILFLLLFPRIYGRHYLILFQGLVANWRKWRHICKNTSRVEIIITTSIENRIKSNTNFGHVLRAIFYTYCYYNVNPWGIFENMTSFSLIRNQALEQGHILNFGYAATLFELSGSNKRGKSVEASLQANLLSNFHKSHVS